MSAIDKIKEKILLLKVRSGDEKAFGVLYDNYIDKIYRFVYFKTRNQHETEDIVSQVFMKAWQYIINDKEIDNLNAFLYRIAHNLVIDFYRSRQKKLDNTISIEGEGLHNVLPDDSNAEEDLIISIEMETIKDGLNKLKDQYREIIILRYVEGFSTGEIAKILNKSAGAIRVTLSRALEALREVLDEAAQQGNENSEHQDNNQKQ